MGSPPAVPLRSSRTSRPFVLWVAIRPACRGAPPAARSRAPSAERVLDRCVATHGGSSFDLGRSPATLPRGADGPGGTAVTSNFYEPRDNLEACRRPLHEAGWVATALQGAHARRRRASALATRTRTECVIRGRDEFGPDTLAPLLLRASGQRRSSSPHLASDAMWPTALSRNGGPFGRVASWRCDQAD